ncbi:MAG: alpha/beta hydrolase [Chloroflexi bacterium]|nr:alpha/beta hydrolase [Chloroflexota bacterium]
MPNAITNGIRTYYEEAGQGEPLVLIHGHTADLRMWAGQVTVFARRYRVITYDVRDHGRSEAPRDGYNWPTYAADLRDLLRHLNIDSAHLLGLSMGGGIAIQLALDYPDMARSLILADAGVEGFHYSSDFADALEGFGEIARREGIRAVMEKVWLPHPVFDGIRRHPQAFARLREMVLTFRGEEYLHAQPYRLNPKPQIDRLGEIRVPTLIIAGSDDMDDFKLLAECVHSCIEGSALRYIAGAGHMVNMEQPQAFNEAVMAFLEGVSNGQWHS